MFARELGSLGFRTQWIEGGDFHRAGHLVAERDGAGPRVLLVGHLDTVFEADSPFQRFERLSPTSARGPGVIDMKGGDVVMLTALRALSDLQLLGRLHVVVVMTGDEEDPGEPLAAARQALLDAAAAVSCMIGRWKPGRAARCDDWPSPCAAAPVPIGRPVSPALRCDCPSVVAAPATPGKA